MNSVKKYIEKNVNVVGNLRNKQRLSNVGVDSLDIRVITINFC